MSDIWEGSTHEQLVDEIDNRQDIIIKLSEAIREIYAIRGEDNAISEIVNRVDGHMS